MEDVQYQQEYQEDSGQLHQTVSVQSDAEDGIGDLQEPFDLHDQAITPLPMDVNLQDIQEADQYNDTEARVDPNPELQAIPTQTFDASDIPVESPASFIDDIDKDEPSEQIPHRRSADANPSRFTVALGLWCEEAGISRVQYTSLLEILRMPELPQKVPTLPKCLSTLKKQTAATLPLLAMRKRSIPLQHTQQSRQKTEEDLIFFDPVHLFKSVVASNIANTLHIGLGEFHDAHQQDELFKSNCWRSSIRTTSGEFAHYPSGQPVFPSDFTTFRCSQRPPYCNKCSTNDFGHRGRVLGVGRDYRAAAIEPKGQVIIQMQEVLHPDEVAVVLDPPAIPNEHILSWDTVFYCTEADIQQRFDVVLDYTFHNDKLEARPAQQYPPNTHIIRRILDSGVQPPAITPLCLNHPIRGELEIQAFGRDHLLQLDSQRSNRRTFSLPLLTFIDGFGLYRNTYRTLMGVYFIFAGLPFHERARRANVIPFTIGPHGSNFSDVIDAIKSLAILDRGAEVEIPGIGRVFLLAFPLAFTGDMPQQQKNSGMKTQRANLGCRLCHVDSQQRGDLDFDTFLEGRYHHTVMSMREDLEAQPTRQAREAYGTKWGIDPNPASMALTSIAPALDIVLSRPGDPAHSEYQGLSSMMHNLLLEAILTPSATREYSAMLRTFPFPPSWPRIQGPLHHLKSYSLSEHARWSIVVPVLLRCWLRPEHVRSHLLTALRAYSINNPVDYVVTQFAAAARSNSVLMSTVVSPDDRENMTLIVHGYRSQLQQLLAALAQSMAADRRRSRSRSVSVGSSAASVDIIAPSLAPSRTTQLNRNEQSKKAEAYESHMKKPNMHIAVHYPALAEEYGLPVNMNVLVGEDKHRAFKKWIYTTNHRHPEKDLLTKENQRQTLRLLLANAFKHSEPTVTKLIKDIHSACPQLFATLLPRSEQMELNGSLVDDAGEDDEEDVQADRAHPLPLVTGCIQPSYIRSKFGLPTRANELSAPAHTSFSKALSDAYGRDYSMPNILVFTGSFQWCKRLSFYDPVSQRRLTFKMLDFFKQSGSRDDRTVLRIDQILVHRYQHQRRVFIKATRINHVLGNDHILGAGYCHLRIAPASPGMYLVGLPSVATEHLYIVPIENTYTGVEAPRLASISSNAEDFLWAKYTLTWL